MIVKAMTRGCFGVLVCMLALSCNWGEIRGCRRVAGVEQNPWGLEYTFQIPSNCPVPLGAIGERKDAGAEIIDNAPFDFDFGEVYVESADGFNTRVYDVNTFSGAGTYRSAIVATGYSAGRGCNCATIPSHIASGALLPSNYFDYATFNATNAFQQLVAWSQIEISYQKSTIVLAVLGPDVPQSHTTGTWTAPTSGGSAPYTYQWYRNGVGSAGFGLRVWTTDQTQSTRWADYWVQVDGVRVAVTGPSTVWANENGGTWTASGRGGYQPYMVDWFIEDAAGGNSEHVGSGESWSGYPGEGFRRLRARLTDSNGAKHESFVKVNGIGGGQCEPEPPAIRC